MAYFIDNPFDSAVDRDYYLEYSHHLEAWKRAKHAFAGLAGGFFIVAYLTGAFVGGGMGSWVCNDFGLVAIGLVWLGWRWFEKICCARIYELETLGCQLRRERSQGEKVASDDLAAAPTRQASAD